jgi:hypothetical protein
MQAASGLENVRLVANEWHNTRSRQLYTHPPWTAQAKPSISHGKYLQETERKPWQYSVYSNMKSLHLFIERRNWKQWRKSMFPR